LKNKQAINAGMHVYCNIMLYNGWPKKTPLTTNFNNFCHIYTVWN